MAPRVGATSHRDFRRLAGSIPDLDQGGVVLNWGSAVLMPEVFLKALTIARNTGAGRPTHFTAADFDMQRHYRPRVNVVQRPTRAGGAGFLLTGHHEILLPLLVWGVLEEVGKRRIGSQQERRGGGEDLGSKSFAPQDIDPCTSSPSKPNPSPLSGDHLPYPGRRRRGEQLQDQIDHEAQEGEPEYRPQQAQDQPNRPKTTLRRNIATIANTANPNRFRNMLASS